MSESLINSLNQRITELERSKSDLGRALKEARRERTAAREEADTLRTQVQSLTTDRDGWKQKAEAAPTEKDARIAELEGSLRSVRFERAFEAEAIKAGVRPEAVADLLKLSGLTVPESDDAIKPEAFAEFLGSAKESRAWAFGESSPDAGGTTSGAGNGQTQGHGFGATQPPAGAGRGASGHASAPVRYTRDDISRPDWMTARPELAKAIAEGRAKMAGD